MKYKAQTRDKDLKYGPWKMAEIRIIQENWMTKNDREISVLLSRPIYTVRWMRGIKLGLKRVLTNKGGI